MQADRGSPPSLLGGHRCSWEEGSFCPEQPHLLHAWSYGAHLLGSLLCPFAHLGAEAAGCTRVLAALPALFVLRELPICARKKRRENRGSAKAMRGGGRGL